MPNAEAEFLRRLRDRVSSNSAPTLLRYSYHALGLLYLASVAASWGNLGQLIVLSIVLIGLATTIWTFNRIARSRNPIIAAVGLTFGLSAFGSCIVFFITILYYLATGDPKQLDRIFAVPQTFDWNTASVRVDGNSDSELRAIWENLPDATQIEIHVQPRGADGKSIVVPAEGTSGTATIGNLTAGTEYLVTFNASAHQWIFTPHSQSGWTHAKHGIYGGKSLDLGYSYIYSGPLTKNGLPSNGSLLTVELVAPSLAMDIGIATNPDRAKNTNDTVLYRGALIDGRPHGKGTIVSGRRGCSNGTCDSVCQIVAREGRFEEGVCDRLIVGNAEFCYRPGFRATRNWLILKRSVYSGGVSAEHQSKGDAIGPPLRIGPINLVLHGKGKLSSGDITIVGQWDRDLMTGHGSARSSGGWLFEGEFLDGCLENGMRYRLPFSAAPGAHVSSHVVRGVQGGSYGILVRPYSVLFGKIDTFGNVRNGYSVYVDERGRLRILPHLDGALSNLGIHVANGEPRCDAPFGPTFPQTSDDTPSQFATDQNRIWDLSCDRTIDDTKRCHISNSDRTFLFTGTRKNNESAELTASLGSGADKSGLIVSLGDHQVHLAHDTELGLTTKAFMAATLMCFATDARNISENTSVNPAGFCPLLATLFARLYGCAA